MCIVPPLAGLTGFHICQAHVTSKGDNIKSIQTDPYYEDKPKQDYPSVIEKTTILLEHVHTDDTEDPNDDNKLVFQFMAIMVSTDDLETARDYYITAGVEYGIDEHVWIGQAKVTSVLLSRVSQSAYM